MHAALERAYEFYIRVVCRHHNVGADQFEAAWKDTNLSERQLGAFIFLYLREMGEHLPVNKKITEIRNSVIHRGHIATAGEARQFGEMVFRRIDAIEKGLARFPEATRAEAAHELEIQQQSVPAGLKHGVFQVQSVLFEDGVVTGPVSTFEQYLSGVQQGLAKGWA